MNAIRYDAWPVPVLQVLEVAARGMCSSGRPARPPTAALFAPVAAHVGE